MYLEKRLKEAIAAGLPRKELNHTECFVCPWCGSDQLDEHPPEDGLGPFDCTVCHKSFASDMDANGTLYTQGLMTDADMRYMAWKAARKIKVGRRALEQEGRMDWQPIETAETRDGVLLYSPKFGTQMGRTYRHSNGEVTAVAYGFHGDWEITHWMPLPPPPAAGQEG